MRCSLGRDANYRDLLSQCSLYANLCGKYTDISSRVLAKAAQQEAAPALISSPIPPAIYCTCWQSLNTKLYGGTPTDTQLTCPSTPYPTPLPRFFCLATLPSCIPYALGTYNIVSYLSSRMNGYIYMCMHNTSEHSVVGFLPEAICLSLI